MRDDRRVRLGGAEFLPHGGVFAGKQRAQHDGERDVQLLEQPADAGNAPVDAVLPEGLVDEIRIAAHHVRPVDRALAEAELLDEEGKADGNLLAARPRRDVDRLTREAGNGIGRILRHTRRRKLRGERERDTGESGTHDRTLRSHRCPFTSSAERRRRCRPRRYRRRTGAGPRPSCAADRAACPTALPAPCRPSVRSGAGR